MYARDSRDMSQITDYLFVSSAPQATDAAAIAGHNIGLVISMIGNRRPPAVFDKAPLRLLWLETYDTFLTPIPTNKLLRGVQAALSVIEDGRAVLCYCAKGRHRSVAMAAAILIAQGCSAADAMAQLRARRQVAHPQAWHIRRRIEQFERVWQQPGERRVQARPQPEERYSEFVTNSLSKLLWSLGLGQNR
jgi:protein-tyrosine phosphatase